MSLRLGFRWKLSLTDLSLRLFSYGEGLRINDQDLFKLAVYVYVIVYFGRSKKKKIIVLPY